MKTFWDEIVDYKISTTKFIIISSSFEKAIKAIYNSSSAGELLIYISQFFNLIFFSE